MRQQKPFHSLLPQWIDSFWDEEGWSESTVRDRLDVYETDNEVVVKAPIPGVKDDNVNIIFEDGVLRIRGSSEETEEEKNEKKNVYSQQKLVSFDYMTTLPRSVSSDKINAEVENGLVTIRAPIKPESQPKQIKVKAGGKNKNMKKYVKK